ncbi:deoxyhypusine synthase [Methanobacterium sp.]|jgi:deoxyhypusine synthase|uniref:deoxyhypusine synthase n=1 Tax=Methanobacterium sp. TaxID=2164 RepID=UPI003158FFA5
MEVKENMSVLDLIEEMGKSGVLGAGRVSKATQLFADSIKDEDTSIFLSVAGPLVPGGLRKIIFDLINDGFVDVLITSGANITHDLVESFGGGHYRGISADDEELQKHGMGRIGDVYTKSHDFEVFEEKISEILSKIAEKKKIISIREFLFEIGNMIEDENSILKIAAEKGVPIYAPGIIDSMLGLQLWMFTQDKELHLDAVGDMHELSDIVFDAKKVTTVLLGGGLPKHYALASNLLKGGVDAAIQVTMDRSETGSLSGAPLEEAKSWAKAKAGSNLVTVIGDVTIIFPMMVAGAREIIAR